MTTPADFIHTDTEAKIETAVKAALIAALATASTAGNLASYQDAETPLDPALRFFWLPDTNAEGEEGEDEDLSFPVVDWITYPNIQAGHASAFRAAEWELNILTASGPDDDPKAQDARTLYKVARDFLDAQALTFDEAAALRFIAWEITSTDIKVGDGADDLTVINLTGTVNIQTLASS